MALISVGMSFVPVSGLTASIVVILVAFVVATGAVVGATHGLALIWLLRLRDCERYAADATPPWGDRLRRASVRTATK